MPTYEYQCQKCRKLHEAFQSITARPLRTCPHCRGRLKRLMGSGSGFLFRGSGFYITDYRSRRYLDAQRKDQPKKDEGKTAPSSSSSPARPDS